MALLMCRELGSLYRFQEIWTHTLPCLFILPLLILDNHPPKGSLTMCLYKVSPVCVCVCVWTWHKSRAICVSLHFQVISFLSTCGVFLPHHSFSHFSLASLASWLLLPLWMLWSHTVSGCTEISWVSGILSVCPSPWLDP